MPEILMIPIVTNIKSKSFLDLLYTSSEHRRRPLIYVNMINLWLLDEGRVSFKLCLTPSEALTWPNPAELTCTQWNLTWSKVITKTLPPKGGSEFLNRKLILICYIIYFYVFLERWSRSVKHFVRSLITDSFKIMTFMV